jgi:predicted XRE-type DNA-binding protein
MSKFVTFDSVWDAIEDTPQEAASMRARSELLSAMQQWIKLNGITQTEAARRFGITQPRMSDLVRGKIQLFSLEALMDMATVAGLQPRIQVKVPRAQRRSASRANLAVA